MRTVCKAEHPTPYSLHDMRVTGIGWEGNRLVLSFGEGIRRIGSPGSPVPGRVILEGADPEDCQALFLGEPGCPGVFSGRRQELAEFLREHPSFELEILEELYGYRRVYYEGILSLPGQEKPIDFGIFAFFEGTIVYETEESSC